MDQNIIFNPEFNLGLEGWHTNSCKASILPPANGNPCICAVTGRKQPWQGLEQELTRRVQVNVKYTLSAYVMVASESGNSEEVKATLRLESPGSPTKYIPIGKVKASISRWSKLDGSFSIDYIPGKVIFYLEGPPASVDILVKYIVISPYTSPESRQTDQNGSSLQRKEYLLKNPKFEQGLEHWNGKCCKALVVESSTLGGNSPFKYVAIATNRTQQWQGIEQNITGLLKSAKKYEVSALVKISGGVASAQVLATLWTKSGSKDERFITLGKVTASSTEWVQIKGSFLLDSIPQNAAVYVEGPPAGTDILINEFNIFCMSKIPPIKPTIKEPNFGVNILENSGFLKGLDDWCSLGSCLLEVCSGAPLTIPPIAKESLGIHHPVSGLYIAAKNRQHIWEGQSQDISEKIKAFVTYQVSAWVRIGAGATGPQKVNICLGVDGKWLNGGEIEGETNCWKEVAGSFRLESQPQNVLFYVQGPAPGVDLMVANPLVFAIDRPSRFKMLKAQTDKIRKDNAVIRLRKDGIPISNVLVEVRQVHNNYPFGSCIGSYNFKKQFYLEFFLKTFNWAVFENELKWYWTEKNRNELNYKEADELCDFCIKHGILMRGHCIFWEVDDAVQDWVKKLNDNELSAAVQNRAIDLLSRYRGKFAHYDVNNEMLHGSFFKDRLGADIWPYMFKLAEMFDPDAKLFVNDYHIEDGFDAVSSPEKYIQHIRDLQAHGANVGGIGIQGHITFPIGPVISNALDKLAILGLPVWFTEVDVESPNEYLRAEDLEVILRELYAHPAVEGIMLWGFMETAMFRENSHLLDADGTINEAGKALISLKQEWLTTTAGKTDEMGCFSFRGYHGSYTVSIKTFEGKVLHKDFHLKKSEDNILTVNL